MDQTPPKTVLTGKQFKLRRITSNKMIMTGFFLLISITTVSLLAGVLASYGPFQTNPVNRLMTPGAEHLFGTDNVGRDLFSRVLHGTRVSLLVGGSVAVIASLVGLIIGLLSAYYRWLDHILMRICDGLFAFPSILLAIAIVAALGPAIRNVIIALSIVSIPSIARVVRASALVVKEQTYIEALKAQGANSFRIIVIHMIPNVLSPLIVQVTFVFAMSIVTEAALSFLGAGVPAPAPSLGNILYDGKTVIFTAWWMTVFPGAFIILLVLGLNLLGDGLRDLLDPHSFSVKGFKKKKWRVKTHADSLRG